MARQYFRKLILVMGLAAALLSCTQNKPSTVEQTTETKPVYFKKVYSGPPWESPAVFCVDYEGKPIGDPIDSPEGFSSFHQTVNVLRQDGTGEFFKRLNDTSCEYRGNSVEDSMRESDKRLNFTCAVQNYADANHDRKISDQEVAMLREEVCRKFGKTIYEPLSHK